MTLYNETQYARDVQAAIHGLVSVDYTARLRWRTKWPENSTIADRLAYIGAMRVRSWVRSPSRELAQAASSTVI